MRLIPHARYRFTLAAVTGALLAATVACEGRTSGLLVTGPTGGVRVRMLNALPSSPTLDFLVDGQVATTGVAYANASPYASLTVGSHRLQARSSTGTTVVDFTRDLNTQGSFSFIPAPGLSQSAALFIADDPTPVSGQAKVRVVHVAAAPGAVSVYVTAGTADLSTATPVAPSVAFGTASSYVALAAGTYRVRVTPAGNPSTVLLDTGNIALAAGTVRTLMLTDAPGGGLPTTLSILSDGN
ncbi:MAG TPA: DUF4397 domain-containing protein [Gemmatimonadaceae bacterium]|nr:DUF4397 domain-containing protein [Gemmatimonadaceae bacterium]